MARSTEPMEGAKGVGCAGGRSGAAVMEMFYQMERTAFDSRLKPP
jgi:hypothetical protein